jgi:hypothetical protein
MQEAVISIKSFLHAGSAIVNVSALSEEDAMWGRVSVIVLALVILSGQGFSERDHERWFGDWLLLCRKLEAGKIERAVASYARLNDAWVMFIFGHDHQEQLAARLQVMADEEHLDSYTQAIVVKPYLDDAEVAPIQLDCGARFCTSERLSPKFERLFKTRRLKLVFPGKYEHDTATFELSGFQEALSEMVHRSREKLACAPRL